MLASPNPLLTSGGTVTFFAILILFPLLMAYAAFSDMLSMTIANWVSVLLVAGFLLASLCLGTPPKEIGTHFALGFLCLVLTFGCFAMGWMGGGDAKLIAATALWFGPTQGLFDYLLLGAVYGGVLTLGLLAARAAFIPMTGVKFVDRLLETETGIPYGIGLGAAGLTAYASSDWVVLAVRSLG